MIDHTLTTSHRSLKESANSFPTEFASYKVLPALISALEFGGASAAAIVPLVLQFGKGVSPEEYPTVILTHLVKLYASPDRGTRMALLDHLPEYADKMDKKTVCDKVWPNLVSEPARHGNICKRSQTTVANWFQRYCGDHSRGNRQVDHPVVGQGPWS